MASGSDSDSIDSDFSGFSEGDIEERVRRSDGSDISVSDPSSVSSDSDESSDEEASTWSTNLSRPNVTTFSQRVGALFEPTAEKKEIDFFLKFFPVCLIEMLVRETNNYASHCLQTKADKLWTATNYNEMMAFIGMHVVLSVLAMPSYKLLWRSTWPFAIPSVPQIMTRTRFEKLTKYFHVNDTSQNPARGQPGHDKLCHIRPLLDAVSKTCLENYGPHKEQSVDEGMIAFKGCLSFKQYLPAKPTKFGIKVWERASPHNGYVHEFQIYTGKQGGGDREEGLGSRVVRDLTKSLKGRSHIIYMDNFFSSPTLFESLRKDKIYCLGTVRANRKGMTEALRSLRLKNRGDSQVLQKGNLVAMAWKDKKLVYYLTTSADPNEQRKVRRRQKDGSYRQVPAPLVSELYNKYMFGVDLADQKRMQYSTCRKATKWWKYLFWFCFDVAVVNSFICYQESPNHKKFTKNNREIKVKQLDFRIALAQQFIGAFRGSRKRKIPSTMDNCGNAHWPVKTEKPRRCRQYSKEGKWHEISVECKACGISLCVDRNCFFKYHKDNLK